MKQRTKSKSGGRAAYWRKHVESWVASGETATLYAKRHGLAVQSLYQAKYRLGKSPSTSAPPARSGVSFARVRVREETKPEAAVFRMRLSSGLVLEWCPAPAPAEIAALIERCEHER